MPRLIVGHAGTDTVRLWVRGTEERPVAFMTVRDAAGAVASSPHQRLEERHFYTGIFEIEALQPDTEYTCDVGYGPVSTTPPAEREVPPDSSGRFRTAEAHSTRPLNFLFGSCNQHSLGIIAPPNPAYRRLSREARDRDADFMLHCGDQIYYDVPDFDKAPRIEDYRRKYLDAWDDSDETRKFLTELPHYMILDDHEIRDNFHNDMVVIDGSIETLRDFSLKVYREFQHLHNPQTWGHEPLYYTFSWGDVRFFVLDTRTERFALGPLRQMIGQTQKERFMDWLIAHRDDVKFVVSSVPFVGEVITSDEKWTGSPYRAQRHEILDFVCAHQIPGVVFLTGDMHNSYHARMELVHPSGARLEVHELMSSPINQLGKSSRDRYLTGVATPLSFGWQYTTTFPFSAGAERFYTGHSNAVHVKVDGRRIELRVFRTKKDRVPLSGAFDV